MKLNSADRLGKPSQERPSKVKLDGNFNAASTKCEADNTDYQGPKDMFQPKKPNRGQDTSQAQDLLGVGSQFK
ncbi:uncharacterized protein PG998_012164 [Apiospora kogelbergensis]|uniref:Uncharacterized protein n=1 Tax=Apiospora kogelbergensis TaxID=1337665 RepID=A0AAW0QLY3_9PEZI